MARGTMSAAMASEVIASMPAQPPIAMMTAEATTATEPRASTVASTVAARMLRLWAPWR